MSDEHLEFLDAAKTAIVNLYSDKSVGPDVTKESLEELLEEIETRVEALEMDEDMMETDGEE